MNVVTAWKDSLGIFKPANFKLFFLVTLKSYIETMKVWLVHWGWLAVAFLGLSYFVSHFYAEPMTFLSMGASDFLNKAKMTEGYWLRFLALLTVLLLWTSLYLASRPSVKIKNFIYFTSYWKHTLWIGLWSVALAFVVRGLVAVWPFPLSTVAVSSPSPWLFLISYLGVALLFTLLSWLTSFFILFLLDSDGSCKSAHKSLGRAFKLLWYNLPFCIIMSLVLLFIYFAVIYVIVLLTQLISTQLFGSVYSPIIYVQRVFDLLVAMPVFACVATNFYIKKIHDQFTLYFGERS